MRVPEMFSDHGMFMFLYALMDESGIKISESWQRNQRKGYIRTHCTVLAQLELCNVTKYAFN